jgi:hypothetical protein
MMEPKLILYEDLKEDYYHNLLFSSAPVMYDARFSSNN